MTNYNVGKNVGKRKKVWHKLCSQDPKGVARSSIVSCTLVALQTDVHIRFKMNKGASPERRGAKQAPWKGRWECPPKWHHVQGDLTAEECMRSHLNSCLDMYPTALASTCTVGFGREGSKDVAGMCASDLSAKQPPHTRYTPTLARVLQLLMAPRTIAPSLKAPTHS